MNATEQVATGNLAKAFTVGVVSSMAGDSGDSSNNDNDDGDCLDSFCGAGGWIAAVIAALCFGSYGVPIKATLNVEVHPLVLQSYKSAALFITSWFVIFSGEDNIKFTPWGILSGFLWVVGGTGGIYGIRNAGMAIAIGTWSSVMVIVNFVWGILIFQEPVYSYFETFCAFILLGLGLVGMSKYSAASASSSPDEFSLTEGDENYPEPEFVPIDAANEDEINSDNGDEETNTNRVHLTARRKNAINDEDPGAILDDSDTDGKEEYNPLLHQNEDSKQSDPEDRLVHLPFFTGKVAVTKRQLGIALSVCNGLLSGSSLLPLHKAKSEGFGGLAYVPSCGCGALISNTFVWFVFVAINFVRLQRIQQSTQEEGRSSTVWSNMKQSLGNIPSFHFKELWFRGTLAGLLISVAMFSSIVATTYLGQGVGNSLVQSKILVSGLWGIFWFREISNPQAIAKWFLSAGLCIISIIWLTFERLAAKAAVK